MTIHTTQFCVGVPGREMLAWASRLFTALKDIEEYVSQHRTIEHYDDIFSQAVISLHLDTEFTRAVSAFKNEDLRQLGTDLNISSAGFWLVSEGLGLGDFAAAFIQQVLKHHGYVGQVMFQSALSAHEVRPDSYGGETYVINRHQIFHGSTQDIAEFLLDHLNWVGDRKAGNGRDWIGVRELIDMGVPA